MGPADLQAVLRPLAAFRHPDLLVGLGPGDDAAIYRINATQAIIHTVDFFPPVVDDPYTYGAIAAANSLSDVYAMGGTVLMALNIAAYPSGLPLEGLTAIFQGGADKVAEAGAVIAGGHTVTDPEPKYGLAVTGIIHPDKILTKAGGRPGDRLILTKPLGSGLVTTALKAGVALPEHIEVAVNTMLRLNKVASELAQEVGISACTDVTGFGLLGHAGEMAEASDVSLRFWASELPLLPGALDYAADDLVPGGAVRNKRFVQPRLRLDPAVPTQLHEILFDPQTSGGLLIALHPDKVDRFIQLCRDREQPCWVVGEVVVGSGVEVVA